MGKAPEQSASSNRRAKRAIGCCLLVPAVIALCLFAAYKIDNVEPQITIPGHDMPQDNARDYFLKAVNISRSMRHKSPYDMAGTPAQDNTLANFKACAADAEPALKIMREGLNHPFMETPARSFKTWLPDFAQYRELARIHAGAADYYAVSGNPGRAMQMHLDGLEVGVMIPHGGVLIGGLVGIACEAIAESRMEPLIPRLSSTELAAAATRLDQIEAKRVEYADIIQEEGYLDAAGFIEMIKDEKKTNPYTTAMSLMDADDATTDLRERVHNRLSAVRFLLQSKQAIVRDNLNWFKAMAKEARGQYAGPSKVTVPDNLMAQLSGGTFNDVRPKFEGMKTALILLRVEVALYRYRKRHGIFPAALSDLMPAYLPTVPMDPFGGAAGKPLRYGLKPDGSFLLYSLGPDMKDNGGTPARFINSIPGDIVAGKLYHKNPILYAGAVNGQ